VADRDRLFAHRLIEKPRQNGELVLITRGDSHWRSDPPRSASTLLGQVVAVTRNGGILNAPFPATLAERLYGLAVSECRGRLNGGSAILPRHVRHVAQRVRGAALPLVRYLHRLSSGGWKVLAGQK
jgi:hypothetical protein